jgi:hypothetical protein
VHRLAGLVRVVLDCAFYSVYLSTKCFYRTADNGKVQGCIVQIQILRDDVRLEKEGKWSESAAKRKKMLKGSSHIVCVTMRKAHSHTDTHEDQNKTRSLLDTLLPT